MNSTLIASSAPGRPRLLDLFCCAGGAGMGYHQAGFEVVGVDVEAQPRYPFQFIQADALDVLADRGFMAGFDAVHASPPCHDHSSLASIAGRDGSAWLLDATRQALAGLAVPWVIENVPGAPLRHPLWLCGTEFGLSTVNPSRGRVWLKRHRGFESNALLMGAGGCTCSARRGHIIGVYGHGDGGGRGWKGTYSDRKQVMGIDWMNRDELAQAIPPAMTRFIGEQLLSHLTPAGHARVTVPAPRRNLEGGAL